MNRIFTFILFFSVFSFALSAQNETPLFAISGSVLKTHMNYGKSYLGDTYTNAYEGRLYIDPGNSFRVALSFEQVPLTNLEPIWFNIKSSYVDIDLQLTARGNDKRNFFYFMFGITGQFWSAYYSGQNDSPANAAYFQSYLNKQYSTFYPGVTTGAGFEFKVFRNVSLYSELRVRLCQNEKIKDFSFGLNDEVVNAGLKIGIVKPWKEGLFQPDHLHKYIEPKPEKKAVKKRHFFRMPGNRYYWF